MENREFSRTRRMIVGGLGGLVFAPVLGFPVFAQGGPNLTLRTVARMARLKAGLPESPIWGLEAEGNLASLRFKQGEKLQVSLSNELSGLSAWNFIGFDGLNAAEPLISQKPLANGGRTGFSLPLRQAGTFLIDARLLGDGKERPSPVRALIVEDANPASVDRDEVLLIEDWRVMPDGRALAPDTDPKNFDPKNFDPKNLDPKNLDPKNLDLEDAATIYTVNGQSQFDINLRPNERLRLRVINGCQRAPIGVRIENHDVRVMAIDSQPAEPFPANKGQLVMAPGSRTDVLIDATQPPGSTSAILLYDGTTPIPIARLIVSIGAPLRPAPLPAAAAFSAAHLPAQLDLKNAARVELQLDGKSPWVAPTDFATAMPPAFQMKRSRVVVMTITNPTKDITTFRLHGHHFRLLDRLDDGWKPFWLDTLLLNAGQTQRVAFLAEYPGQWLIEATGIDWSAQKLLRFYAVT